MIKFKMKPTNVYWVIFLTGFWGAIIHALILVWFGRDLFVGFDFLGTLVLILLNILISFVFLIPFHALILIVQELKLKGMFRYDGWIWHLLAFISYSCLAFYWEVDLRHLLHWIMAYYPIGIAHFWWYSLLSSNKYDSIEKVD